MSKSKHSQRRRPAKPAPAASARPQVEAPERWPALTGLRGMAALAVLVLHAYELAGAPESVPAPLGWLFANGWAGVDVFFTLSAFLLTFQFLPRAAGGAGDEALPQTPPGYARRRLMRVLPAYYAQLLVVLTLGWLGLGVIASWNNLTATQIAGNALFLYGALPSMPAIVPVWWTLPVELGFYLTLPFFARLLRPGRWPWLLLFVATSLAYRFWILDGNFSRREEVAWLEQLPGRLHQFLIGMLAAYAYRSLERRSNLPRGALAEGLGLGALIAFLALPALGVVVNGQTFANLPGREPLLLCWHAIASVLIAVVLVCLASGPTRLVSLLGCTPLRWLGMISYSLYLWHFPVLLALRNGLGGYAGIHDDFAPFFVLGLMFSLIASAVSWWLVERPSQRWRFRRGGSPFVLSDASR